jgi:c-di-AMP phosphodiesterase-like protein
MRKIDSFEEKMRHVVDNATFNLNSSLTVLLNPKHLHDKSYVRSVREILFYLFIVKNSLNNQINLRENILEAIAKEYLRE